MRKRLSTALSRIRWSRGIAVFAAAMVLLAASFFAVIHTSWFQQELLRRMVERIEIATGGRVEIGAYEFEPFQLRATLRDVAVYNAAGEGSPAFLRVPSLQAQLGVTSLLRREVFLRSLRIDSPEVLIEIAEDGATNLPAFSGAGERPVTEELFDLAVERMDLTDGSLVWNGARYPLSFSARQLFLNTRFERAQERYRAWFRVGELAIALQARKPVLAEAEAEFFLYRDRIEAPEVYLARQGVQAWGRVEIAPLSAPTASIDYQATLDLPLLGDWFPAAQASSGEAKTEGQARWQAAERTLAYEGRLSVANLALRTSRGSFPPMELTAAYRGDEQRVAFTGLEGRALGGVFAGEAEIDDIGAAAQRFRIHGDFDGFPLQELLMASGVAPDAAREPAWNSSLRGWLRAEGSGAADLEGALSLILAPAAGGPGGIALTGVADIAYSAPSRTIRVPRLELTSSAGQLWAQGTVHPEGGASLEWRAETENAGDLLALAKNVGVAWGGAGAEELAIRGGARFEGTLQGDLTASPRRIEIQGRFDVADLVVHGYEWQRFHGDVAFAPTRFSISRSRLENKDAFAEITGALGLQDGKPTGESELEGDVRFANLPVAGVLDAMGRNEPLTGQAEGSVQVAGTWAEPRATATLQVVRGTAWRQPFDSLRATLRMDARTQTIESLELTQGPAQLHASGGLNGAEGKFSFAVRGSQWRLEDLEALKNGQDFGGEIQFDLAGTGRLASQERSLELLGASGVVQLSGLRLGEREIGSFAGKIRNQPQGVQVDWEGNLVTGTLAGSTLLHPGDESPATGEFSWSNVDVADLAAFAGLSTEKLSGETDGNFTFSGPLLAVDQWRAEGEITRLEISYSEIPGSDRGYSLWNPFPMRWSVANHELHLDRMRLLGDGTDVLVDGAFGLEAPRALDLSTSGTFNLAVIEGFRPELQASGSSVLEVTLRGTAAEPRMNGRMEMRNASLRHNDFANGLSQMNGVLRFSDRQVSIERLTALSGGGTLEFRGMAEHSQEQWSYRLDTGFEHVRFRYPDPVSSVVDGNLTLSGTNLQSLMSGEILVSRVTISSNLELGTMLANLAEPRQTLPSNPALGNMQMNVRIDSVPDLRIETALIRGATADLDLRLAGSALNPALLGEIGMTQGELDFQGTRFYINRGNISFVNPFRIDPVIDFELETRVRDTDISLTLSGPARKINVTPRSDPPLPFSELVTLLALGRTPTTDPVLAARQSVAQQQLTQSGANTVLSQALSQPVNRRLQRFFGVSRLKVDPQSGGAEANPSARISTEQQITNEITFTYSYDLSSAQQQVVRVDYTPTRQWSFIVTRDENGLVGADVLFKKRLR